MPLAFSLCIPKQAVLKSLLGHVSSAIPSQRPSCTFSRQNCLVQLLHGLSSVGNSKMVLLEPQKHLQNMTGFAPRTGDAVKTT